MERTNVDRDGDPRVLVQVAAERDDRHRVEPLSAKGRDQIDERLDTVTRGEEERSVAALRDDAAGTDREHTSRYPRPKGEHRVELDEQRADVGMVVSVGDAPDDRARHPDRQRDADQRRRSNDA